MWRPAVSGPAGWIKRILSVVFVAALVFGGIQLLPLAVPFAGWLVNATYNAFSGLQGPPVPVATADFAGSGPGSLITATTMPSVTQTREGRNLRAVRVVYRSTSGDTGAPTVVSGSVFTPLGSPPATGWPVVAVGHGTVGIDGPCGPSLSPWLEGALSFVAPLIERGYAVSVADYEGLGVKGSHPYLDARTAGLNMIDSVRALRHAFPGETSTLWAAFGHSQGGAAAWAADEQAGAYAPELQILGAVAAAPAADVTKFVDLAATGTLSREQRLSMPLIVESLARRHPELNRDDFRRDAAAQNWDILTACQGSELMQRSAVADKLIGTEFAPRTPEAGELLRKFLQQWALPQRPLTAPMSVWYGGADAYINPEWTRAAIERACAMGGSVTVEFQPGKGHSDVDLATQLQWLLDRFAGRPVHNDC
jgi:alpha-beta hydrolase superfamily lysophospholipase